MTTSWEDQDIFCDNDSDEHAAQECDRVHPSTEIIPDRYAFWVIGHRTESLYVAGRIADFRIEAIGDFFNYSNFVAFRREGLRPDLQATLRRAR